MHSCFTLVANKSVSKVLRGCVIHVRAYLNSSDEGKPALQTRYYYSAVAYATLESLGGLQVADALTDNYMNAITFQFYPCLSALTRRLANVGKTP